MLEAPSVNNYVVRRLREERIARRLKLKDMSRRTGIPQGSYSCLETGRYRLNLENLFRILAVLGLPIDKVWLSVNLVCEDRTLDGRSR